MFDEARRVLREARSAAVVACYEYWLQKRAHAGRCLPGRQHLDPVEMKGFLEHVVLFDVVPDGVYNRFRHRLIGTHFAEVLGRDVTGMYIEHSGSLEIFDEVYRRFSTVVDEKALAYGVTRWPAKRGGLIPYEHLTLPLAADGETVDMLFGVRCVFVEPPTPVHRYATAPLIHKLMPARS